MLILHLILNSKRKNNAILNILRATNSHNNGTFGLSSEHLKAVIHAYTDEMRWTTCGHGTGTNLVQKLANTIHSHIFTLNENSYNPRWGLIEIFEAR